MALVAGLVAFRVIGALSQASWDGGRRRVLCVDETEVGNQLVLSGYLPHVVERGSPTSNRPATGGKLPNGGGANEAYVDNKGLKRTTRAIMLKVNEILAFRANELRGVKSFVM